METIHFAVEELIYISFLVKILMVLNLIVLMNPIIFKESVDYEQ